MKIAALALAALLTAAASSATAQAGLGGKLWKWSKHKLDLGDSNVIALDAQGQPHVAYRHPAETGEHHVVYAWFDGEDWHTEDVDSDGYLVLHDSLVLDADGAAHLVYSVYKSVPFVGAEYLLRYAHNDGGSWQVDELGPGGSASLAFDAAGTLHIAYLQFTYHAPTSTLTSVVRHRELAPGGWEEETIATAEGYFSGPCLIADEGPVRIAYSDPDHQIHLATRDAGTWSIEDVGEGDLFATGSMVVAQDGSVHLVHDLGDHELRHTWKSPEGWQHATLVTESTLFGGAVPQAWSLFPGAPDLAEDLAGRIHLVFCLTVHAGNKHGRTLVAATLEDGAWLPKAAGPAQSGLSPSIAVAPSGIVHVSTAKAINADDLAVLTLRLKGAKLRLSVVPAGAGTITDTLTGATCDGKLIESFYPGTEVPLSATPAPGYGFVGWFKDAEGTEPETSVSVDKTRRVVARFEPLPR